MVWFKVDDTFASHPKARAAGNAAIGLWTLAGAWCSRHLTDGFIPDHIVKLHGTPAQAQRLVRVGLWEPVDGGYRFHDWAECQPSSARIRAERKRHAEWKAKRRKAETSAPTDDEREPTPDDVDGRSQHFRDGENDAIDPLFSAAPQVNDGCPSVPTRPDPSGGGGRAHAAAREGGATDPVRVALVERLAVALGVTVAAASDGLAVLEHDPEIVSPPAIVESFLRDDRLAALARRLKIRGSRFGPSRRRRGPLLPLCGECDARPGDPPNARIVWLDAAHTQSVPCPRCHPERAGHAS